VTFRRRCSLSRNFPAFDTWMVKRSRGFETGGFAAAIVLKIAATRALSMAQFESD
jgi:hypothetical protein